MRGPALDWGVIRLKPGESLGGHYHEEVEEVFYVKRGLAVFVSGGKEMRASEGEAFRFEPLEDHDVRNDSAEAVDLVFIKHPYRPDDKVAL